MTKHLNLMIFIWLFIIFSLQYLILVSNSYAYRIDDLKSKVKSGKLPYYCLHVNMPNHTPMEFPSHYKDFLKKYGKTWSAMHHYCWGRDKVNLALGLYHNNTQHRNHYLNSAVGEFDYVLRNSEKDFILIPEILLNKSYVLFYLKKYHEAVKALNQAIHSKNDYVPAYILLSRIYTILQNERKARNIIEIGLRYVPTSKRLKMELSRLSAS